MLVSRGDDDTVRARLRMRLILPRDKLWAVFFLFFLAASFLFEKQTNTQINRERECVSALCATSDIVVYHPFLHIFILNTLNTKAKARATNHLWRKTEAAARDFLD